MATTAQSGQRKRRFLAALRECGNVSMAARLSKVPRSDVYLWKESDAEFAVEFSDAEREATDVLVGEARRRAVEGTEKPVYQNGKRVGTVREFSDTLLMFLIKQRDNSFRDNVKHEVTGPNGGEVAIRLTFDRAELNDGSADT